MEAITEDQEDQEDQLADDKQPEKVEETTLEQYKRKERERKQRKRDDKIARKESSTTNPQPTDLGFDDPFFTTDASSATSLKRKEKEQARQAEAEAARERAEKATELELLMHDEAPDTGSHFNINHILKAQKSAKHKKKAKKRDGERELDLQEGFKMDVNDPRFADVYGGGEFAIDPNSAAFRKGLPGMEELLKENRRRKRDVEGGNHEQSKKKRK
jgi:hypothetical protein